jgi:hypothetical protein
MSHRHDSAVVVGAGIAASDDPVVCRKFFDVLNLLSPPSSLMSPAGHVARPCTPRAARRWYAVGGLHAATACLPGLTDVRGYGLTGASTASRRHYNH